MDDESIPMESMSIAYDEDAATEDDSSSQGGMMTTAKVELELKPRPVRVEEEAENEMEVCPLQVSPMLDHDYASGDAPPSTSYDDSRNNKRKSAPGDSAQKKSRLDFSEERASSQVIKEEDCGDPTSSSSTSPSTINRSTVSIDQSSTVSIDQSSTVSSYYPVCVKKEEEDIDEEELDIDRSLYTSAHQKVPVVEDPLEYANRSLREIIDCGTKCKNGLTSLCDQSHTRKLLLAFPCFSFCYIDGQLLIYHRTPNEIVRLAKEKLKRLEEAGEEDIPPREADNPYLWHELVTLFRDNRSYFMWRDCLPGESKVREPYHSFALRSMYEKVEKLSEIDRCNADLILRVKERAKQKEEAKRLNRPLPPSYICSSDLWAADRSRIGGGCMMNGSIDGPSTSSLGGIEGGSRSSIDDAMELIQEDEEQIPSSSRSGNMRELRPIVEFDMNCERRQRDEEASAVARAMVENERHDVTEEEKIWIEQFQRMSMSSRKAVLNQLIDTCDPPIVQYLQRIIEPHFQRDFLSNLPAEIGLKILEHLPAHAICRIARVCKRWRALCDDDDLWKKKCYSEWINEVPHPTYRAFGLWEDQPGHSSARSVTVPGMMSEDEIKDHRRYRLTLYGQCYKRSPHKSLFLRMARIVQNWRRKRIAATCIFKGHDDHVITCLQLHNDMIVTGSDDNTLKVWSVNEPLPKATSDPTHLRHTLVGHSGGVWTSQVSDDGKYIVSGSTDRTVRVWCAETGEQLHCLTGHTSTVRCMALHGTTLISGSRDTTLRVWDIERGKLRQVLVGHVAAVRCVQSNGIKVASGAYDFTVKIWNARTGECIHTLQGHTNRVYSLLMDSERDVVVSGSLDTTIRVWNMTTGVCTANLVGHTSLTSGMQLKGDILVSCNADSYIRVWNIKDNQCLHRLGGPPHGHLSAITSLQFLDSGLVATSSDDGTVKLWDVTRGVFVRDLVKLTSGGSGGCIWRLKASESLLVCAVGSRNGTEDTKLILLDFDASFP